MKLEERTFGTPCSVSFLYLTLYINISVFYSFSSFIYLSIYLFIYLFNLFYFYVWCDILTILPTQYM